MISNERSSAGTSTNRRPDLLREGESSVASLAIAMAPGPVAGSDCDSSIDAGGWEYIDVMLSRLMKS